MTQIEKLKTTKCVCGEQKCLGGAEVEIGGVCHRPNKPCYVKTPMTKNRQCKNCFGKGYFTEFEGDSFCMADFIGDKTYRTRKAGIRIHLCNCTRAKDLQKYFTIKRKFL